MLTWLLVLLFPWLFDGPVDEDPPAVSIVSSAADPTNVGPIPVNVVFTESVTGFEESDLQVSNATVRNFGGINHAYGFELFPLAEGIVTVDVPAGVAADESGNGNTAAPTLSRLFDTTVPTVALSSDASDPADVSPIVVVATFSEAVTGFSSDDIAVSNATIRNFDGAGASYTFELVPQSFGIVAAVVAAGAAIDAAGNPCAASAPFGRLFADMIAPSVEMTSPLPNPTSVSPITVTVTFSEEVTGFAASDVSADNATVTDFAGSGAHYTFGLVPTANGTVQATIAPGAAQDSSGNENEEGATFSRVYDGTTPSVTLASSAADPTNLSPIPVSVTFSEAVIGFEVNDLVVANASVNAFSGSGATYSFDLYPHANGLVRVDIPADSAHDALDHGNTAAYFSRTYVGAPPTSLEAVIEVNEADWVIALRQQGYFAGVTKTRSYAPFAIFLEGWQSTPREDIVEYLWDFGDGSEPFLGFNAAHVYETPGDYTITLTVTNELGWTATDYLAIEVLQSDGVTYYVDAELGDDGSDGTSPGSAWGTAQHAFDRSYAPGDRVLFRRGQTFPMEAEAISYSSWRNRYGYMFGAFGDGSKPLLQLVGSQGAWFFPESPMAYVAFVDLAFNMTSAEDLKATLFSATSAQNVMFLRCDVESCHRAFLFLGDSDSDFIVDCTCYDSLSVHLYMKCSRVAILDSVFDYSVNGHNAYLSTLDKGVVTGCSFSRCPRGQHALRLSGSDGTNNVVITKNTFTGWDDPLYEGTAHSGHGYNWLLVHLAPNTSGFQTMNDVTFEDNLLEGGRHLLNVGNYENLVVRNNVLNVVDTAEDSIIAIGGLHSWDTVPLRNVTFTENTVYAPAMEGSPTYVRPVWSVLPYSGSAYQGRTRYENIRIEKNVILMEGGLSRLLRFEENDPAQIAEVHSDNQVVYCEHEDDELYQVGGTCYAQSGTRYTLEGWLQYAGCGASTLVVPYAPEPYADAVAPVPGWASTWALAQGDRVPVAYHGAFDLGQSGLKEVRLWVKIADGQWQDTGMAAPGAEGQFEYSVLEGQAQTTYRFALQAQDYAGNLSPVPVGTGHCETVLY